MTISSLKQMFKLFCRHENKKQTNKISPNFEHNQKMRSINFSVRNVANSGLEEDFSLLTLPRILFSFLYFKLQDKC